MNFWLLKSEPKEYSWQDMLKDKDTCWDGVHNYQALNNMKKMIIGDLAFFYHSNTDKAIMGIVQISKEFYHHDIFDGVVNVSFYADIKRIITLQEIKCNPALNNMATVKQPRLSVSPVTSAEWNTILGS